jgi:Leucine Rich Repeat (LRR) protein
MIPAFKMLFQGRRSFHLRSLALLSAIYCTSCGQYSPIVDSAKDILKLDPSEQIIRARGLSDDDIPALPHLKSLRHLQFGAGHKAGPAKLTDVGLKRLSEINLPELRILDLGHCDRITDAGLGYVAMMTNLEHLILGACLGISNTGLLHVARMDNLKWLGLAKCEKITDSGIKVLVRMTNLEALDLRGCLGITDAALKYLAEMKQLKYILLGGCDSVSQRAVEQLAIDLPGARIRRNDRYWKLEKE